MLVAVGLRDNFKHWEQNGDETKPFCAVTHLPNSVGEFSRTILTDACVFIILHTCLAGVIYQDDLFEQDSRRCVKDTVDRPQEGGPGLVVKDNNDAGGRQRGTAAKLPLNTPGEHKALTHEKNANVAGVSDGPDGCRAACGERLSAHAM